MEKIKILFKILFSWGIVVGIIVILYFANQSDIYDRNHRHEETLNIIYQNDPTKNWQKYSDIKFEYKGEVYTAKEFHSRIDLTKNKGVFTLFINDEGKLYKCRFIKYIN